MSRTSGSRASSCCSKLSTSRLTGVSSRFSVQYSAFSIQSLLKTEVKVACSSRLRRRVGVEVAIAIGVVVVVQPAAELAAGCVDGPPLGLAHRHADAPVAQDRDEPVDGHGIGPAERQA